MSEKICSFAAEFKEIPRLNLGLALAADSLLAANRLLWQRGIKLEFKLIAPADSDKNQVISCELVECLTGPMFYGESKNTQVD
jgi:hypothetical protein